MAEHLFDTRAGLDQALADLLLRARRQIRIFDGELDSFLLESPPRIALLQDFLRRPGASLTLVLQAPQGALDRCPRLAALWRRHAPAFSILQAPDSLAALQDALCLMDEDGAVVRFHRDQARGKSIDGDAAACAPYRRRFEAILEEDCQALPASPLGL